MDPNDLCRSIKIIDSGEILRMIYRVLLVLILSFVSFPLFSQDDKPIDPIGLNRAVQFPKLDKKGCCKIKYPGGGFDYFMVTEKECKKHVFFDQFLGEGNSMCLRWDE